MTIKVKFQNKLVNLDSICVDDDVAIQSRKSGHEDRVVDQLVRSIEAVGLKEHISVEIMEYDENDPDNATYKLRDGNHRLKAYKQLLKKHGMGSNYVSIPAVVYEKNLDPGSVSEWLLWQFLQNQHLDKIHLKNSFKDTVYIVERLLCSGNLCPVAKKAIDLSNWEDPSIANAIRNFANNNCKGWILAEKDSLIEAVYESRGQTYKSYVKRYSRDDVSRVLQSQFNCNSPGALSQDGKTRVWVTNNNDSQKQILFPLRDLIKAGTKSVKNVMVFHSKQRDTNQIDSKRQRFVESVKAINTWVSTNVTGFSGKRLIDEVKFLGQKLQQGESAGNLTNVKM